MAGDWIKVEMTTPDKPEIRLISRRCKCSRGDAFLAWFRLYRWFDSNTEDGVVRFFSASDADEIGTLPGLASALQEAGWLTFVDDACTIANFDRHNGRSAKRRGLDSERKRKDRDALSAGCPQA